MSHFLFVSDMNFKSRFTSLFKVPFYILILIFWASVWTHKILCIWEPLQLLSTMFACLQWVFVRYVEVNVQMVFWNEDFEVLRNQITLA